MSFYRQPGESLRAWCDRIYVARDAGQPTDRHQQQVLAHALQEAVAIERLLAHRKSIGDERPT